MLYNFMINRLHTENHAAPAPIIGNLFCNFSGRRRRRYAHHRMKNGDLMYAAEVILYREVR